MEDYLNQLLDKLNEYKSIVNYRMEYIFEDDFAISFKLKQTDFPHCHIQMLLLISMHL